LNDALQRTEGIALSNPIVTVAVSQQIAPAASNLQQRGALISQGGTTIPVGTAAILTQDSDLTPLLAAPLAVTSVTWSGGTATVTTAAPHNVPTTDTFLTTIAGAIPVNYNGTFSATSTGTSTFTYALASDGGTSPATGTITYTANTQVSLVNKVTEFFAQGNAVVVSVLELGPGTPAAGVTALENYIQSPANLNGIPQAFYLYFVPGSWNTETTAVTLATENASLSSKVYFFVPTSLTTYSPWLGIKSVATGAKAAAAPATEETLIAMFYRILSQNPGPVTKLQPTAFAFQFDVTPFGPTGAQATTLKTNYINYIDTGAEGGISNTILKYGRTMDGHDFSYWYAVDWMQINLQEILANAIINGANDPVNPLVYNQPGINTLQAVAQGIINNGITFGVINNATVVAAVSFQAYTAANPGDYATGTYNGLSCTAVPQTGFDSITFNLTVSDFGTATV
jgi:hypothetical protein